MCGERGDPSLSQDEEWAALFREMEQRSCALAVRLDADAAKTCACMTARWLYVAHAYVHVHPKAAADNSIPGVCWCRIQFLCMFEEFSS